MEFIYNYETDIFEPISADFTVKQTRAMPQGAYVFILFYEDIKMGFLVKRTCKTISEGDREKKIRPTYEMSWEIQSPELPNDKNIRKLIHEKYKKEFLERMMIFLWTYTGYLTKGNNTVAAVTHGETISRWLSAKEIP